MITSDDELSLCVEICVEDATWVEDLPPAPSSGRVSVSFDDAGLAARDRAAVEELGYPCVGVAATRNAHQVAHVLVSQATVTAHTRWWRAVLDAAERVYDLRFGPVQVLLRDVIALHHRIDVGPSSPRPRGETRSAATLQRSATSAPDHPNV